MATNTPTLRGSATLFTFRGIRVYLHWSFLLLVGYVVYTGLKAGLDLAGLIGMLGTVLLVFSCVVLHEFGHALMAQRYGVHTKDITLLPIGGVANLERMPEEPKQEFWITVAGPAVNLIIAGIAFVIMGIMGIGVMLARDPFLVGSWSQVVLTLFVMNLWLFLFNLVPAFPMDGGRIVRSLLSMLMPRDRATRIAAMLGRLFAIGFVAFGLLRGLPFLALIGMFIFFAAGAEARMVEQRTALRGVRVMNVMRTRFWTLDASVTVQHAVDELLTGGDHDLVVLDRERYLGVLTRRDLVQALSEGLQQRALSGLTLSTPPVIGPQTDVNEAYTNLLTGQHPLLPVMEGERLVGVLEPENLAEYLMVQGVLRDRHATR